MSCRDIVQMYTGFVPLSKIAIALSVNFSLLRKFAIDHGFVTVALQRRECLSPADVKKLIKLAKASGLANPIVKERTREGPDPASQTAHVQRVIKIVY